MYNKFMRKIRKVYKLQYKRLIVLLGLVVMMLVGVIAGGIFIANQMTPEEKKPVAVYTKHTALRNEERQTAAQITDQYFPNGKKPPEPKQPIHTDRKIVALTFDDGPGNNSTQRILDSLEKHDVKATFFVLGSKIEQNPDMLKQIHDEGHEIGNHSYNHPDLTKLTHEEMMSQITNTNQLIKDNTGETPKYLRPPYGAFTPDIELSSGMTVILWNVDSNDWRLRDGPKTKDFVLQHLQPQSVILFHDIYESSADTVEHLIPALKEQGYEFVTMSEYLEIMGLD